MAPLTTTTGGNAEDNNEEAPPQKAATPEKSLNPEVVALPKPPVIPVGFTPADAPVAPNTAAAVPPKPPAAKPAVGAPDISAILLPKKEKPIETQSRANAAVVLQAATPTPHVQKTPTPEQLRESAHTIRETLAAEKGSAPAAEAAPANTVAAMHTFKGDLAHTVEEGNISMIDVAAAQSRKKTAALEEPSAMPIGKWAMIGGGIVLFAAAMGALIYVVSLRTQSVPAPEQEVAPLIFVDTSVPVPYEPTQSRLSFLNTLQNVRTNTSLPLGLVATLDITALGNTADTPDIPLEVQTLIELLAPEIDSSFARAFLGPYVFGVHSFDENQPFLILKTNNYETVFRRMLEWEPTMRADLLPLFERTPATRIPENGTTTPAVYTSILQTPFIDRIVENQNARVMQNDAGDILLLWAFVDRETLVITTNEYTLRELIERLKNAPVVTLPGQ